MFDDVARRDPALVRRRAWSTGCGSTTPTGCATPAGYLDRLAALTGRRYVVVEKILEPGEELPPAWACAGTTGYDVLALRRPGAHRAGRRGRCPRPAARGRSTSPTLTHDTKRAVADHRCRPRCAGSSASCPRQPASPGGAARRGGRAARVLPGLPLLPAPRASSTWRWRFASARARRPDLLAGARRAGAGPVRPGASRPRCGSSRPRGMVMAKGVEDCAFYRYSRLTSLNEVGGDPSVFSTTVAEFHEAMAAPAARTGRTR